MLLWARKEKRQEGDVLVLFRREVVATPRGPMIEEVSIMVITDSRCPSDVYDGKAVELTYDGISYDAATTGMSMAIRAKVSSQAPVDPKLPSAKFSDPSSTEAQRKKARGMSWKAAAVPGQTVGTPPVPVEQQGGQPTGPSHAATATAA